MPPGPAARSIVTGPGAVSSGEGQSDELAALVLDRSTAVTNRRQLAGIAAGKVDRPRRPQAGLGPGAGVGQQFLTRHPARDEVHVGTGVVSRQGDFELGRARITQRIGERVDDPSRMRVHHRQVPAGVDVVRGCRRLGCLGDPAHDGVGEAGRTRRHRTDEIDGGGNRRPGRHARPPHLVSAEPERITYRRVDRALDEPVERDVEAPLSS